MELRAFDPNDGAIAVLFAPLQGNRALVLPGGWGVRSRVLAHYGAAVWHLDIAPERIRAAALLGKDYPITHVLSDQLLPLPFAEATFDLVLLRPDELSIQSGQGWSQRISRSARLRPYLEEIHRVLTPGGTLILDVTNRWSYERRPRNLHRSFIHNLRSRVDRKQAPAPSPRPGEGWRTETGLSGYRRVLGAAGFASGQTMVYWPSIDRWRQLVAYERLKDLSLRGAGAEAPDARTRRRIGRALQQLRLLGRILPGYVLVAPKADTNQADRAGLFWTNRHSNPPPTIRYSAPWTVAVDGGSDFVKVGLLPEGVQRLEREIERTEAARRSSFAPWVVGTSTLYREKGVTFARFPFVEHDPDVTYERLVAEVDRVLSSLDQTVRRLDETQFWRRLHHDDEVRKGMELLEASDVLDLILKHCGGRLLPTGPVHGDLRFTNLRLSPEGQLVIVDWLTFQECLPLYLDAAFVAVQYARLRLGKSPREALRELFGGELSGPLATGTRALMGELSPAAAAAVDTISHLGVNDAGHIWDIENRRAGIAAVRDLLTIKGSF